MSNIVIQFPGVWRPTAAKAPPRKGPAHVGRKLTPRPFNHLELAIINLLGWLMRDRGRQIALLGRLRFHFAALGLDANPTFVAGLRHAIHAVAMLFGTQPATDRSDARNKVVCFSDLPCDSHVAIALVACVEADRIALNLDPADLA